MASRPRNLTAKHRVVSGSNSQSPIGADHRFKERQQERRKYGKINNSVNINGLQFNSNSMSQDIAGIEAPLSGAKVSEEEKQEE